MDRLIRLRAPLAVCALAVLSLVALARAGLGLSELATADGSRAVAAARLAPNGSDAALTVLVGLLVVACFAAPGVPARRAFALWTVVLTAVSVLATVVALSLSDLEVAGWSLVWLIPDVAVPVLVGVVGVLLVRADPAERDETVTRRSELGETGPILPAREAEAAPDPGPDPELQPSWSEDSAAGAVWRTAGEAARGAPALGWDPDQAAWPTPAPPERDEQS